ncbi:hypothetical protein B0H16DRAFT_1503006 [Mycena metata]|uniref:Uncharacterized protein n=1 Tax=Mycena metata TaxID=1033252 RepID=A0AAD7K6P0_9AGAR|nr:hypothetical protein B0H16DRAFT_1503006 [Mycena metata]
MLGNPSAAPWRLRLPEKVVRDGEERVDDEEWREEDRITPLAPTEWLAKWQEDKAHRSPPPRSTPPQDATRPKDSMTRPEPSPTGPEAAPPERDGQQNVGLRRRLWDRYSREHDVNLSPNDEEDLSNLYCVPRIKSDRMQCVTIPCTSEVAEHCVLSSFTTSVPPRVFGDSSSNYLQMDRF